MLNKLILIGVALIGLLCSCNNPTCFIYFNDGKTISSNECFIFNNFVTYKEDGLTINIPVYKVKKVVW